MEMLENLSQLYLYSLHLVKIPAGILPRLRNLYRSTLYFGSEALRETMKEAGRLSNRLDTFEGYFYKLSDFNIYVKSTDGRGSTNFDFLVGSVRDIFLKWLLPPEIFREKVQGKSVRIVSHEICNVTIVLPKDVESLTMENIPDVTSLNDVLPREQGLVNFGKFSHDLKVLKFNGCPNLKKLFSLQLLPYLQNLGFLEVCHCNISEEIVAVDDEEIEKELGKNTIINVTLPRLKMLRFVELPVFKSVCSDHAVLVCNSLQEIEVRGCPKLKRFSLSLPLLDKGQPSPPPALEVIKTEKELWDHWSGIKPMLKMSLILTVPNP